MDPNVAEIYEEEFERAEREVELLPATLDRTSRLVQMRRRGGRVRNLAAERTANRVGTTAWSQFVNDQAVQRGKRERGVDSSRWRQQVDEEGLTVAYYTDESGCRAWGGGLVPYRADTVPEAVDGLVRMFERVHRVAVDNLHVVEAAKPLT